MANDLASIPVDVLERIETRDPTFRSPLKKRFKRAEIVVVSSPNEEERQDDPH
jgi:hypothetical protein